MNELLRNLMAQMESWEAANEFGISEVDWADYDARNRADDIYIASLCEIYDTFRIADHEQRTAAFGSLAKTLLIYSRSAAAKYLRGIEKNLNLLYCSALFYLSQSPATGTFVSRGISDVEHFNSEESFLYRLLSRASATQDELDLLLRETIDSASESVFQQLDSVVLSRIADGLRTEPRKHLGALFCRWVIWQFREFNIWNQLRQNASGYERNIWDTLLNAKGSFPLWELLPSQITALKAGLLRGDEKTISLQMPTSSGKTSLCELLIFQEVKIQKRRVLFLVPFRALAAEIHNGICGRLEQTGISILASYGGNVPTRSEAASTETADVLITTPEKFTALMQAIPEIEKSFQTVICDEGHLIDDQGRGLQYELLLTRLRAKEAGSKRFVFISAIIPNVGDIHAWLGGLPDSLAVSTYKPVPVDYAFLAAQRDSWRLEVNPIYPRPRSFFLQRFLTKDDFRFLNRGTKKMNLLPGYGTNLSLACASALKARKAGPVALFTTTRGPQGINGLSEKMLSMLDLQVNVAKASGDEVESDLTEYLAFLFGVGHLLARLTSWGIGYHHGQLPQEVRRVMEEAIENGGITLLLCTTTLAEGVNLPIRTLVVHTVRRFDQAENSLIFIKNRSIKNIIGRAGRAGKETRGRVVFICENERHQLEVVLRDLQMEPARGALYRLTDQISKHLTRHNIALENSVLESQQPWFLALLDGIDFSLVELLPEGISTHDIPALIDELLSRTLAGTQAQTALFKNTLIRLFQIRADSLEKSLPRSVWPILKASGSSPRFYECAKKSGIFENELWRTLDDPFHEEWMTEIITPLLAFSTLSISSNEGVIIKCISSWMAGNTYYEISQSCENSIDDTLELLSGDIGYHLQEHVAKVSQLAMAYFGEDKLSELARAWPSLLQFGLSTLQQLDLVERGVSDRLSLWSIQRFLAFNHVDARGPRLRKHIRQNKAPLLQWLESDVRLPRLCLDRVIAELKLD